MVQFLLKKLQVFIFVCPVTEQIPSKKKGNKTKKINHSITPDFRVKLVINPVTAWSAYEMKCYATTKDLNTLAQVKMNEPSNSLAFIAAPRSGLCAPIESRCVRAASAHKTCSSLMHSSAEELPAIHTKKKKVIIILAIYHYNLQ